MSPRSALKLSCPPPPRCCCTCVLFIIATLKLSCAAVTSMLPPTRAPGHTAPPQREGQCWLPGPQKGVLDRLVGWEDAICGPLHGLCAVLLQVAEVAAALLVDQQGGPARARRLLKLGYELELPARLAVAVFQPVVRD